MGSRSRQGGINVQAFLIEAGRNLASIGKASQSESITTMKLESDRLKGFMTRAVFEAESFLQTGLADNLISNSFYFPPPSPSPHVRIRPPDDYYLRFVPKQLREYPGFKPETMIPECDYAAGIAIEGSVYFSATRNETNLELQFEVNYEDTLTAFKWLLQEWRRPIGQLLRGLPELELWGNGTTIDGPPTNRRREPVARLEHHLAESHARPDDNLFSLRHSFSPEDTDQDVVLTIAVYLSLFDAIYKLTTQRANPDCLLRHYLALEPHLPKAPFRIKTIFSKSREAISGSESSDTENTYGE